MSRPIYEPSLPRTDAQLGFGNRQLFRRPRPMGDSGPPWIALYDNFVWGQQVGGAQPDNVRLKYEAVVISDNGDDYFDFDTIADAELGEDIYVPILKQGGVFAFSYWLDWFDPSESASMYRVFFNQLAGGYDFPGELTTTGGFQWDFLNNVPAAFSDWAVFNHATTVLPIRLNNVPPDPCTLDPRLIMLGPPTPPFECVIGHKRLWITRLGDLNSTAVWPQDGIGS